MSEPKYISLPPLYPDSKKREMAPPLRFPEDTLAKEIPCISYLRRFEPKTMDRAKSSLSGQTLFMFAICYELSFIVNRGGGRCLLLVRAELVVSRLAVSGEAQCFACKLKRRGRGFL